MKRKQHLQTNFLKFIIEKYSKERQNGSDDEDPTDISNDTKIKDDNTEIEETDEELDEVDKLIKEYKKLNKKYESIRVSNRKSK